MLIDSEQYVHMDDSPYFVNSRNHSGYRKNLNEAARVIPAESPKPSASILSTEGLNGEVNRKFLINYGYKPWLLASVETALKPNNFIKK
jgi:hypothetical protein